MPTLLIPVNLSSLPSPISGPGTETGLLSLNLPGHPSPTGTPVRGQGNVWGWLLMASPSLLWHPCLTKAEPKLFTLADMGEL